MPKKQIKKLLKLALITSYPFILVTILGFFIMPNKVEYLKEIIAFGFLTLIFSSFIFLFSAKTIKKISFVFSLLILSILAFIKLSFYANYNAKISPSALYVIFETNENEASDYLSGYFTLNILIILSIIIILFTTSTIYLFKQTAFNINTKNVYRYFATIIIALSAYCIHWKFSNENITLMSINSYIDYKEIKANIDENLAHTTSANIEVVSSLNIPQTYVVIIGESASRKHMQLYGYSRESNPKLKEIKNELIVFEDVITPNTHTIIALDKILTLSDYHFPNKDKNASIVQLANQAGFTTYWISNQQPAGFNESIPTQIGSAAKNKFFLNTHDNKYYNTHDDILLPTIEKVLSNKTIKKKILFIHLMGSHILYNKRYPESFNYFKSNKESFKTFDEEAKTTINEYDNSIRFNDFIVRSIIETTRKAKTNSYVLYFSDHGDDVYDTSDTFLGHGEYYGTKPMYTIPFIVWLSDSYKKQFPYMFNDLSIVKRPYILEDFIHSFSEISHINFKKINYKKSIFNKDFKVKKRIIKKDEDYDKKK